ncbi:HAD family hydrolase [Streptomyces poonensis]|uniref:HAD family hydrolase n=1 Tax=Streptomyces poonensis TaxID=68255 RepID=UPI001E63C441|nr:HAD family hydrolase [Streptomyces poonensis]
MDTTESGPAADRTEDLRHLRQLVARARHVVFDFDGPVCFLFPGSSAERVARDRAEWLREHGLHGLLMEEDRGHPDPYLVLSAVAGRHPGSDLVAELEERLTRQELAEVPRAWPTPYADVLVRTWTALGARLAIATDTSDRPVLSYLDSRGLTGCFAPHVYGRTPVPDLRLPGPHPHAVRRALNALGAAAGTSLVIGDTPADFAAAREAGTAFVGYAPNERGERRLLEAGVPRRHLVSSLDVLLRAVREG